MRKSFTLADLAPEIDDAEVLALHVSPGDSVAEDDDLLDIVTDKATVTIPVPTASSVLILHCVPSQRIAAGDTVVTLDLCD